MSTPRQELKEATRHRLEALTPDIPDADRRRLERSAAEIAWEANRRGLPAAAAVELGVRRAIAGFAVVSNGAGPDPAAVAGLGQPELETWLASLAEEEGRIAEQALHLWGWPDTTQILDKERSAPFIDGPLRQVALQLVEAEERLAAKTLKHARIWGDPALLVEIAVKSAGDRAALLGEPRQAARLFRRWRRDFGRLGMAPEFDRLAPVVLDKLSVDLLRMLRKDHLERADVAAAWAFHDFRRRVGM